MSYKYPPNFNSANYYTSKELYKELRGLEPLIDPNIYLISNYGRIWNLEEQSFLPKELIKNKNEYVRVQLKDIYGNYNTHSVHKLVGFIYLNIPYRDDIFIDHLDGVKWHNEPYNLELVTRSENIKRSISIGTKPIYYGEESPKSALTDEQYNEICYLLQQGLTPTEIDNVLDYPNQSVVNIATNIRKGKTCQHIAANYDFSNAYTKDVSNKFTDQQVHHICKLLELDFNISTRDILKNLGFDSDINVMDKLEYERFRSVIKAIKYRKRYKNISKDYNF